MNERQRKFIDDITWGLKMNVPQLIAVGLAKKDVETVHNLMRDILYVEGVTPVFQMRDCENSRHLILIQTDPLWGWVVRRVNDKWDWQSVIQDLLEILHE